MNNNRQKPTAPEKTNVKKIPRLQKLRLEQLDGVAGGPIVDTEEGEVDPE